MTLISSDYRELNRELHENGSGYGMGGWRWIAPAVHFAQTCGARTVLDYGAGKGTFAKWFPQRLGMEVYSYDPVTYPSPPPACDFVFCGDVLEHIEPDHLDAVLDDLRAKTRKAALLVISTRPAKKTLSDGRNAHLIIQDASWWAERLQARYGSVKIVPEPELVRDDEALLICRV